MILLVLADSLICVVVRWLLVRTTLTTGSCVFHPLAQGCSHGNNRSVKSEQVLPCEHI